MKLFMLAGRHSGFLIALVIIFTVWMDGKDKADKVRIEAFSQGVEEGVNRALIQYKAVGDRMKMFGVCGELNEPSEKECVNYQYGPPKMVWPTTARWPSNSLLGNGE